MVGGAVVLSTRSGTVSDGLGAREVDLDGSVSNLLDFDAVCRRSCSCGGVCAGIGCAAGDEHRDAAQGCGATQRVQDFHVYFL